MHFFFVDLETTGLDAQKDNILELGIIVTDLRLDKLSGRSWYCDPPSNYKEKMDPVVVEMHTKNGLIQAIDEGRGIDLRTVAGLALEFCHVFESNLGEFPLCGSSIHFDRAFLKHHLSSFESSFFRRNIDVSTIKELVKRWHPSRLPAKSQSGHRALADLEFTIEELRHYKSEFFAEALGAKAA